MPNEALVMFDDKIDELSFDCFALRKILKGEELSKGIIYLFERNHLFMNLNIPIEKMTAFIIKI